MRTTTGKVAQMTGYSRETVLADLRRLHIEPERDSRGHRLLSEAEVERLLALRRQRNRNRDRGHR